MATGKIARLPRDVREQLNRRLENGEPGNRLVVWLNDLPEVKALLAAEFGGAAVNEQNLSNWRQGGYRDWVVERRVESWGSRLAGEKRSATSEQLLTLYTVRYLVMARDWAREKVEKPRRCMRKWRVLGHDIMKLRQSEHRVERLKLDWERLEFGRERFEDQKQSDERRAMIGFLVAAREWPEVTEALEGAFRLVRKRKIEDGGLKVEDGLDGSTVGCQNAMVGKRGSRGRSPHHAIVPSRGSLNLPGRCPALRPVPTLQHGVQMGVNKAELESIKVNQGEKFLKREADGQDEDGWVGHFDRINRMGRMSGRQGQYIVQIHPCFGNIGVAVLEDGHTLANSPAGSRRSSCSATDSTCLGVNWTKLDQIKVNQGPCGRLPVSRTRTICSASSLACRAGPVSPRSELATARSYV